MSERKKDENELKISGRLTQDTNVKQVGEHTLAEFNIATNLFKGVGFFNVKAWRDAASEAAGLHKDDFVTVVGSLGFSSWTNKEGKKQYATYINADQIFLKKLGDISQENIVEESDIPF